MENIIDDIQSQPMDIPSAAETSQIQSTLLQKDDVVLLDGRPCRVQDKIVSFTGKHGSAKVRVIGKDIYTGEMFEDIRPISHQFEIPVCKE